MGTGDSLLPVLDALSKKSVNVSRLKKEVEKYEGRTKYDEAENLDYHSVSGPVMEILKLIDKHLDE